MIYAVSDVHGCLEELKGALEHVDLSKDGSKLVLLGDYIDYGPESGGALRYVWELQRAHGPERVVVLRGNHEEAFLRWLEAYGGPGAGRPDEFGLIPQDDWLEGDRDFHTFRTLLPAPQWQAFQREFSALGVAERNRRAAKLVLDAQPELMAWLKGLPYFHETPEQIFVHAGIDEEAGDWWPWGTPEYVFVEKFPASSGPFYKDIVAGHVGTAGLSGDPDYHGVYWDGESHYYLDGSVWESGRLNVLAWDQEEGYRQWDGGGWRGVGE